MTTFLVTALIVGLYLYATSLFPPSGFQHDSRYKTGWRDNKVPPNVTQRADARQLGAALMSIAILIARLGSLGTRSVAVAVNAQHASSPMCAHQTAGGRLQKAQ